MSVVPVILSGRQAFDPRATLFAHNEAGVWYDPSDLGAMFQDSAGTTPVTAVEQAVGLILDKSRGLTIGAELVTNPGPFTVTTGWTGQNSATLSVASAKLRVSGNGVAAFPFASTPFTTVVGRGYFVSANVAFVSGVDDSVYIQKSDAAASVVNGITSGTAPATSKSLFFVATATTTYLQLVSDDATDVYDWNNISVREIAGTHAIQATAASRPVLRSRYNLLTYSEDFSNAAWAKDAVTVSGQTITASAGAGFHYISRADAALTGSVTVTWEVKRDNNDWLLFTINDSSINYFNISTGTFGATNPDGLTAVALEDGWYRVTGVRSLSAVQADCGLGLASGNGGGNFTAAGTEKVLVRKVDCRRTIDAISGIPSYQKVEAATVYDTVGFPVYLSFDGSDDSLYTAANLDLSGTDKVTVFAGVTKLSDAATGMLVELGNAISQAFYITAPQGAASTYGWASKGSNTVAITTPTSYAAPTNGVLTGVGDISGDVCTIRVNGVQAATDASDQGTGNFASAVLNIGRRNNASLPFNGRLQQLIVRGAQSSAAEIASTERYVAGKQGRAL